MDLTASLNRIASVDLQTRRQHLLLMLHEINAPFIHYHEPFGKFWPENIIVSLGDRTAPRYVISAHYDNVRGSTGANDNGAGVCILLELLPYYLENTPSLPIDFAFFDLEEAGMIGSQAYLQCTGVENILGMINLDICGVGDTVIAAPGHHVANTPLLDSLHRLQASDQYPLRIIERIPPGDDVAFEQVGIPTITMAVVPESDIDALIDMARCIQLRIPMGAMPSIMETMHNGSRDTVDVIEVAAMQTMLNATRDLIDSLQETR